MPPKTLSSREAAEYLGIPEKTLRDWRCNYPKELNFLKVGPTGRMVRYLVADLDAYLERCRVGIGPRPA